MLDSNIVGEDAKRVNALGGLLNCLMMRSVLRTWD